MPFSKSAAKSSKPKDFPTAIWLICIALACSIAFALVDTTLAQAQSFRETANFLITGDATRAEVQFGDVNAMLESTSITALDENACTVDLDLAISGVYGQIVAMKMAPAITSRDNSDAPPTSPDDVAVRVHTRINLNNVANWNISEPPSNSGEAGLRATFNGTTEPVIESTVVAVGAGSASVSCASDCVFPVPPSMDMARWLKAMDYMYSRYCTGTQSAF